MAFELDIGFTSLAGSIDCGNQTPGSSTLILTGTTPEGDVNGPIDPVRPCCRKQAMKRWARLPPWPTA